MNTLEASIFNEKIVPALEKVMRWQKLSVEELSRLKGDIIENVWQHTQSCLGRKELLFEQYPEIIKFVDGDILDLTIEFHDVPEAFAKHGDVARGDPDRVRKKIENDEEKIFRDVIVGELGIPDYVLKLYIDYENRSTVEGIIAKLIDKMDAHALWWKNLTDEYIRILLTDANNRGNKFTENAVFLIERFKAIGKSYPELLEILFDYLEQFFLELCNYIPYELQEAQRAGIISARRRLSTEL